MVVTSTGFTKKTYTSIVQDMEVALRHSFTEDVDLSPGSPLSLVVDLFAAELTKAWITLEDVYNSAFLNTSSGAALENIGAIVGVERNLGEKAYGDITFLRTIPLPSGSIKVIPANTIVKTNEVSPLRYKTTQASYFYPLIENETATIINQYSFEVENYPGEIVALSGSNGADYLSNVDTVVGRRVTLILCIQRIPP